jgi:site-specific recombinase XerD
MTSVKVRLYTYRATRNGTYPLVFQILHKREKRVLYSPYRIPKECLDRDCNCVASRRKHKLGNSDEINDYILSVIKKLQTTIDMLDGHPDAEYTAGDIVDLYKYHKDNCRVRVYMESLIFQLKEEGRMGTLNSYQSTLNRIRRFIGNNADIFFSDITPGWLNRFIAWLHKSGLKENTVNFYCRVLRAVYNRAHCDGIEGTLADSPFNKVQFGTVKTAKRAIGGESIKQIAHVDVENDTRLERARDMFLFSFYSRGMSFIDMACLKYENIIDGVIYYKRRKTGQPMRVKLVPQLTDIIEKYRNGSRYVLPILHLGDRALYSQYRTELRKFNNSLKELSWRLKSDISLTSYVARHSWATLAYNSGASVSVISQSLGHTSERITSTYLKGLDPVVVDTLNDKISFMYF